MSIQTVSLQVITSDWYGVDLIVDGGFLTVRLRTVFPTQVEKIQKLLEKNISPALPLGRALSLGRVTINGSCRSAHTLSLGLRGGDLPPDCSDVERELYRVGVDWHKKHQTGGEDHRATEAWLEDLFRTNAKAQTKPVV